MTEAEWLMCDDPGRMLAECPVGVNYRKKLHFALRCCDRVLNLICGPSQRWVLRRAEDLVDGIPDDEPHITAFHVRQLHHSHSENFVLPFVAPPKQFGPESITRSAAQLAAFTSPLIAKNRPSYDQEFAAQAALLREILGNPFRPVTFSPDWRTTTAVAIAQRMYESRDFAVMPILADAIQDAGCNNTDILDHCRDEKQVHVRGCWVVDGVLAKE